MAGIDLLSAVVGFAVGAVAVASVLAVMGRTRMQRREEGKLTSAWRIAELGDDALVVARDILEVDVPAGTRIVASGMVDPAVFQACTVRQTDHVRAEYAVDAHGTRALLFLAGARRGTLALVTAQEQTVARLLAEAKGLWERADPYVERHRVGDLAGRNGVHVETTGTVQEVLPYQEAFLLRLEDDGDIIGVLVTKDPQELVGEEILVRGRLDRDRSGYPVIEATDIRRME